MPNQPPPSGAQTPELPVDAIKELLSNDGDKCRFCSMPSHLGRELHAGYCRVERARAQLTALQQAVADAQKDTERLDWLETNERDLIAPMVVPEFGPKPTPWSVTAAAMGDDGVVDAPSARGAIDAAMTAARTPDPAREEQTDG